MSYTKSSTSGIGPTHARTCLPRADVRTPRQRGNGVGVGAGMCFVSEETGLCAVMACAGSAYGRWEACLQWGLLAGNEPTEGGCPTGAAGPCAATAIALWTHLFWHAALAPLPLVRRHTGTCFNSSVYLGDCAHTVQVACTRAIVFSHTTGVVLIARASQARAVHCAGASPGTAFLYTTGLVAAQPCVQPFHVPT